MLTLIPRPPRPWLALAAVAILAVACAEHGPLAPERSPTTASLAVQHAADNATLATIRRATAKYHDLDAALADGFVLLHPCDNEPGEGVVGAVYVNFARLIDGVPDPASPDALIYEPSANGRPKLVGAEFAVINMGQPAPRFMGATFQSEDEFGVWALHAWVWRPNPDGMFAETNPRVSCWGE